MQSLLKVQVLRKEILFQQTTRREKKNVLVKNDFYFLLRESIAYSVLISAETPKTPNSTGGWTVANYLSRVLFLSLFWFALPFQAVQLLALTLKQRYDIQKVDFKPWNVISFIQSMASSYIKKNKLMKRLSATKRINWDFDFFVIWTV